ncbi:cysteine protease ATG4A-like [Zingiber officinale]|uniref:cysteine protease ATG4A-like n=1 Tax=Zingiber officinale TaxID=94328 RepID=UPI001C4B3D03|nr:cysteine protease ATG4A-like [Zingiber officinale]
MRDPSLAIGFYCRDKDFEDFCSPATQLADKSDGAPLFTIVHNLQPSKPISHNDSCAVGTDAFRSKKFSGIDDQSQQDEWQIL